MRQFGYNFQVQSTFPQGTVLRCKSPLSFGLFVLFMAVTLTCLIVGTRFPGMVHMPDLGRGRHPATLDNCAVLRIRNEGQVDGYLWADIRRSRLNVYASLARAFRVV